MNIFVVLQQHARIVVLQHNAHAGRDTKIPHAHALVGGGRLVRGGGNGCSDAGRCSGSSRREAARAARCGADYGDERQAHLAARRRRRASAPPAAPTARRASERRRPPCRRRDEADVGDVDETCRPRPAQLLAGQELHAAIGHQRVAASGGCRARRRAARRRRCSPCRVSSSAGILWGRAGSRSTRRGQPGILRGDFGWWGPPGG